jgi:hypothetical protein
MILVTVLTATADCNGAPAVLLELDTPGWDTVFATNVRRELATEIANAGLCTTSREALAAATVSVSTKSATTLELRVSSRLSQRQVQQTVELKHIAPSERSFVVGVAAAELLREARTVLPELDPPTPIVLRLGLVGQALVSAGGALLAGATVQGQLSDRRVTVVLGVGTAALLPKKLEGGVLSGVAFSSLARVDVALVQAQGFTVSVGPALDVLVLRLLPTAAVDFVAKAATAAVVLPGGSVCARWEGHGAWLMVRLGAAGTALGFRAGAVGQAGLAVEGVAGMAELGGGLRW